METREVIPRTRSYAAAAGAFITSAGVVTLAIGILLDTALPPLVQAATLGVGVLFALALLVIALRLVSGRGGLVVDEANARVGLGVTSERDTWWLPRADVLGVRVVPEARTGETIERWLAVLAIRDRADVVLARSDDRGTVILVARRLATLGGFPDLEAEPEQPSEDAAAVAEPSAPVASAPATAPLPFAIRRRAALQGILFFFGTSLAVVGLGMFSRVEHDPVFGFLFGPLLGLLGFALLGLTVVKRFAVEELVADGAYLVHSYRLGRLRWGTRRVHAPSPRWHLYVHGMRGAHLELVGGDGILVLGGGATTRSDVDIDALSRLPAAFAASR